MTDSYHRDRVERGRAAAAAMGYVDEMVQGCRQAIIARLISIYRGGTLTHDVAIGSIGELAALDNLMHMLRYTEQQGVISAEKEFGNAEGN